jgi:hypothetical protein
MPPTLSTLPAEIIYEIADCLALPELNALLQTSRLFYQQLNHTLHKRGLAMARPTHRHQEGKHDFCQEKHVQWFVFSPTPQSARCRLALGFNEPWLHPSANIVAWIGLGPFSPINNRPVTRSVLGDDVGCWVQADVESQLSLRA